MSNMEKLARYLRAGYQLHFTDNLPPTGGWFSIFPYNPTAYWGPPEASNEDLEALIEGLPDTPQKGSPEWVGRDE
jgi:hypothetical protein